MLTAISAIFVFFIIVLIHELGHFSVAKISGMKVHEFAIGMGPKLFQVKKGETDYSLRILPIGGYVKVEGEDEASNDSRSLNKMPILTRMLFFAAGAVMNFLLAIVIFTIISYITGVPTTNIREVEQNLPAYEAGIQAGDRITEINNVKIRTWDALVNEINKSNNEEIYVIVERMGQNLEFRINPINEEDTGRLVIGIAPEIKKTFGYAIIGGLQKTLFFLGTMVDFLKMLIRGNVTSGDVAGPVGVISLVGEAARMGFLNLLYIAGFLSVNLGFLNLLPIPALDGSRLMFGFIEIIRGKPINPEKEGFVHFIGFVCLIALMLFVTYKDIIRLEIFR